MDILPPFLAFAMALTDLGESSVLLSTALAASIWFWFSQKRPLAVLWLFAIIGCASTTLILKIGFLACGHLIFGGVIASPSGHSSMSALFYGAVALTICRLSPKAGASRTWLVAGAIVLALAIGVSRVIVHAHTPQEVVTGLAIGFTWLGLFAIILSRLATAVGMPTPAMRYALIVIYGGLLATTLTGQHPPIEGVIYRLASAIQSYYSVCVA